MRQWISYSGWCDCVGTAAAWYATRVHFGPETHAAYMCGEAPGAWARARGVRLGPEE